MISNESIAKAAQYKLEDMFAELPTYPKFQDGIRRAPKRELTLTQKEIELAVKNALRYIPEKWHPQLAPEFLDELLSSGRIVGYRFRPQGELSAKPIDDYEGVTIEGRAFQVMIDNNL
ncbi:MAG: urocanate hydratase, partial [Deltaproteobacteria bacterium]|nr:urocanate hydratase [Deltaproteobacteria bacterium]